MSDACAERIRPEDGEGVGDACAERILRVQQTGFATSARLGSTLVDLLHAALLSALNYVRAHLPSRSKLLPRSTGTLTSSCLTTRLHRLCYFVPRSPHAVALTTSSSSFSFSLSLSLAFPPSRSLSLSLSRKLDLQRRRTSRSGGKAAVFDGAHRRPPLAGRERERERARERERKREGRGGGE